MAKADEVTCRYCKEKINKKTDEFVMPARGQYYHPNCLEKKEEEKDKKTPEQIAKEQIHEKCKSLFKEYYSRRKITNQIATYIKNGHTPQDILKGLEYWYDIKHGDPLKANGGIAILDYIWPEINEYYLKKEQIKEANKNLDLKEEEQIVYNIKRSHIKRPKRVKLFELRF